ncbi:hypothetical protein QA641_32045 [Bradyrhizobium sp. CB1650]|uniref:hypothetical protein n=1 Tax=Bradyrhizobium sp. CB1650 TaxID=3039153 RepID=UPI0024349E74|nr:hypothetical protein [Bradyrhizobium sp. CB1650]WGD50211.1 hypothetical protein QA641_32045 [Bradyrhizobium sp. CB1650]
MDAMLWHRKLLLRSGVRVAQARSSEDHIREGVFDVLLGLGLVVIRQMSVREAEMLLRVNGTPVVRSMRRAAGMRERRTEHGSGGGQQGYREGWAT